jgi:hypothetical protein
LLRAHKDHGAAGGAIVFRHSGSREAAVRNP